MVNIPDDPSDESFDGCINFKDIEDAIHKEHDTLCPETIEKKIREEDGNPENIQERIKKNYEFGSSIKIKLGSASIVGAVVGSSLGVAHYFIFSRNLHYPTPINEDIMIGGVIGGIIGVISGLIVYASVNFQEKLHDNYE